MADAEAAKSLSGLLNGIAQKVYYNNSEITEQLLKRELFPELPQDAFTALHDKMRGLIKSIATADMDHAQLEAFLTAQTRKQGSGGVNAEQAAALSRFWKSQRVRVREICSCVSIQRLQSQSQRSNKRSLVKGLMSSFSSFLSQDSEFVCLEFDEARVNQMLKKMADIQESIDRIVHRT
uniref:Copper metabolism (Murr1) domain containing 1 n=1 Tax=Seriola lalandi dorsalis TaxID=1841481 RepID=A0A3B4WLT2_SERLL